jgi:HPt (histidine-containing phosphotransfer) domain-containing protein
MLEARALTEAAYSVELAFRAGKTADTDPANLASLIATLERELEPAIAAANSLDGEMAALSDCSNCERTIARQPECYKF